MGRTTFILAVMLVAVGCGGKIPFEHRYRAMFNLDDQALTRLQYYTENEFVLQREVASGDAGVAKGKIRVEQGRYIEEVVVEDDTPGVAVAVGENWVDLVFDESGAGSFRFGIVKTSYVAGLADVGQRYYLMNRGGDAAKWGDPVRYGGRDFNLRMKRTPCLAVRKKTISEFDKEREVLPGMRVPEE